MAAFSFQSSKNLTAGEGGMITTNDDALAAACRAIQNCGRLPGGVWYEHHVISGNYRMGEFQGAILNCQLDRLEEQTETRDRNGQYLASRLAAIPGVYPQRRLPDCTRHSYHLFMLRLDAEAFGAPRGMVLRALQAEGIPCSAGYGFSLPQQPLCQNMAFAHYLVVAAPRLHSPRTRCPNRDRLCREEAIWLEQRLFLGSHDDMDDIAGAFQKVYDNREALAAAGVRC